MKSDQPSLRESLRELPRGAWILFFGTFLNKFGTFVLPFLAIYMTGLGYTVRESGLAIGGYGAGTLVASLAGGYLADRLGRRKTIVISMFSGAVAMLLLSQARSLPALVLLAGLAGLTGELYRPAASALLADLVPAGKRVPAFAAYRMAFNAGWAFGPATAGLLAKHSFTWLFFGDATTSLLFGLVAWFALPAGVHETRAGNALGETFRAIRGDARFRQLLLGAFVLVLVFMQVFSTMSLLVKDHGFLPSVYGMLISFNGLLVVLFELPMTMVTRRFPARKAIAVGYLLIGCGFASNLLPRTIPLLALTIMIVTLGEMTAMPLSSAYVADLAPPDKRGLYMGTFGLTGALAFICGPSLGMLLYSLNPTTLWVICGVLGTAAAAIVAADASQKRSASNDVIRDRPSVIRVPAE
jgi:MFS family permease